MGIQNLLPAVKPVMTTNGHISAFRGKRVAVDSFVWLHKATYGCCVELCQGRPTIAWIQYCLSYLEMLIAHEIEVTMVFDGCNLPAKASTNQERRDKRKANRAKADELARQGNHREARNYYAQAVDVTSIMSARLIQVIRQQYPAVHILVAPFEADAQLSYLTMHNLVDAVVSEDSDTIPYACSQIIYKLDRDGTCQYLMLQDLFCKPVERFDCRGFTQDMIIITCILSGCDYVDSPAKGFALKKARDLVALHKTVDGCLKALRLAGLLPLVPYSPAPAGCGDLLEYEVRFHQAYATFHHQVVYDPRSRQTVYRTPLDRAVLPLILQQDLALDFMGTFLEPSLAAAIADGLVCPYSKEPFDLTLAPSVMPTAPRSGSKPPLKRSATTPNFSTPTVSTNFAPRSTTFFGPTTAATASPSLGGKTKTSSYFDLRPYSDSKLLDSRPARVELGPHSADGKVRSLVDIDALTCDLPDIYHIEALCNPPAPPLAAEVASSAAGAKSGGVLSRGTSIRSASPSVVLSSSMGAVRINEATGRGATPTAGGVAAKKQKKTMASTSTKESLLNLRGWQLKRQPIEMKDWTVDGPLRVQLAPRSDQVTPATTQESVAEKVASDLSGEAILTRIGEEAIDLTSSPVPCRVPPSTGPFDLTSDNPFWKYSCSPQV